jgi:hypothetical protein
VNHAGLCPVLHSKKPQVGYTLNRTSEFFTMRVVDGTSPSLSWLWER